MSKFDRVSDEVLAKRKAAIELEQKNRRLEKRELDPRQFADIHSELGCEIIPVFITIHKGGGAIHYGFSPIEDYETDTFEYFDKCTKHNVKSASYKLLSPTGTDDIISLAIKAS